MDILDKSLVCSNEERTIMFSERAYKGRRRARSSKGRFYPQKAMRGLLFLCMAITGFFMLLMPVTSWSHGLAGKRFFPTTLAVDDPFVSDELSFLISHIKGTWRR